MDSPPKQSRKQNDPGYYSKLHQAEEGLADENVAEAGTTMTMTEAPAVVLQAPTNGTVHPFSIDRVGGSRSRGPPTPVGLVEGGKWGTNTYRGCKSQTAFCMCIFCCGALPALIVFCFPFDKRRAYRVTRRKVYDEHGVLIPGGGGAAEVFVDEEYDGSVNREQMVQAFLFSGMLVALVIILYVAYQVGVNNQHHSGY